jgi:hypothetical protein
MHDRDYLSENINRLLLWSGGKPKEFETLSALNVVAGFATTVVCNAGASR